VEKIISSPEDVRAVAAVVASAWLAEPFKQRFVEQPKPVLSEYGIKIPSNIKVIVLEDTPTLLNIVLADRPLDPQNQVRQLPPRADYTTVLAYIYTRQIEDAAFRKRFVSDPHAVFAELHYPIPDEIKINVVFDTATDRYFALPLPPKTRMVVEMHEQNMAVLDATAINANINANVNANVNINGVTNINGALQVNGAAVGTVVVAVAVLI